MNKILLFIILAITVAFIGPAVNQAFLAYHGPDESLDDHHFTTPALSDTAGESGSLAMGIILFMLIAWLSIQFLDDPRRQAFCGWHNSAYLEAGHGKLSGITAPRNLSGLGFFILPQEVKL
jgi:hypothetical protein